ncbi:MAG: RDD family protein [Actinomycetia bacterium]|nr:RDD family protein [Actinomycetes bacterium]
MTQPPLPPGGFPPPSGAYPPPPAGALPKGSYTAWITRVAAYLIDGLPVLALGGIGPVIILATADSDCISESTDLGYGVSCTSEPTTLGLVSLLVFVLAAVIFFVWNYGYRQGTTGSSIGKSWMKFKVVGEKTGQPIGFGPSLLRQFLHLLDGMLCNLGYLWPLWDAKRQTFADKIMSTVCLPI